jgi:hypothetical protein
MQDRFRMRGITDALTRLPFLGGRFTFIEDDGARIVCSRRFGELRWRWRATNPRDAKSGTATSAGRALAAARTAAADLEPAVNPSGRLLRPGTHQNGTTVVPVPMHREDPVPPVLSAAPPARAKHLVRLPGLTVYVEHVGTVRLVCYPAFPRRGYRWSTKEVASASRGASGSLDDALMAARAAAEPIHARARIAAEIESIAEDLRRQGDEARALRLTHAAHALRASDDISR